MKDPGRHGPPENYWELRPSVFVETSEKTQSNMKTKQTETKFKSALGLA